MNGRAWVYYPAVRQVRPRVPLSPDAPILADRCPTLKDALWAAVADLERAYMRGDRAAGVVWSDWTRRLLGASG